ncbi:protein kinase domain-containing protein [Bacillus mycoides]|uniref:protein kinase domain-containing protein n=1 Tax=Bacillus mycoides TaxID=1405 RepID=UPI001C010743|nr:protein kinase [Bacillus mycoides]QWH96979.1 protein kinase [Bacillus mycoides]
MKKEFKKGQVFGSWTLIQFINGGGNGEVWLTESEKGEKFAIKLLKKLTNVAYHRFVDEVETIKNNSDVKGILEIKDHYLPKDQKETAWYVMPLAQSITDYIKSFEAEQIVDVILSIAETLKSLHERGISHRDIKPGNMLVFEDQVCLTDFGLVDYPEKLDLTHKGEMVGPKWTMAPEMKRDPKNANPMLADVYSLGKTLWILLTKEDKGFEGQYLYGSINELKRYQPLIYTNPLDNLIFTCTDNDPTKRPNIQSFIIRLKEWKKLNRDFESRNKRQWTELQESLFPTALPKRVIWENIHDIVKVLNIIGSINDLNHMFYPSGGGNDLKGAKLSHEQGQIELDTGFAEIIKPKRLIFESFDYDPQWNYFRIETESFPPSSVYNYDNWHHPYEYLLELQPGCYGNPKATEETPDGLRTVKRFFKGGDFVIFQKTSIYNKLSDTYDGRHAKMTTEQFRKYIQSGVDAVKQSNKN